MSPVSRTDIPSLSAGVISRRGLIQVGIGRSQVTLVCAPAGAGKTTVVAEWAAARRAAGEHVAWLSLMARDDRPFAWWSSLLAALAAGRGPGSDELDALRPPSEPLVPGFVSSVAEAWSRSERQWLVLDDLHRIADPDVLAGLGLLIADLPDSCGIVLISRSDPLLPLHQMRLAGLLTEIRAEHLAFDEDEAAQLFTSAHLHLTDDDVHRLVERTEGWAAGLRLSALSLIGEPDPVAFIDALEGDRRAVADYLFAEIIQHLAEDVIQFLLDTSVAEQLTVDLAVALSGRQDAGNVLESLVHANALVVEVADGYRYHGLMRSYLLARLRRGNRSAFTQRHTVAARWFEAQDMPEMAIGHAVRAEDDRLIADIITKYGVRLTVRGHSRLVIDSVQQRPAVLDTNPAVPDIAAIAAYDVGEVMLGHRLLHQASECPDDQQRQARHAVAVMQRSLLGGESAPESLVSHVAPTLDPDVDLLVAVNRAAWHGSLLNLERCKNDLQTALELARHDRHDQFVVEALGHMAAVDSLTSDLSDCRQRLREAFDLARLRGWATSPRLARSYVVAAAVGYLTGEAREEQEYADAAVVCLSTATTTEVQFMARIQQAGARARTSTGSERRAAVATSHAAWLSSAADNLSTQVMANLVIPLVQMPLLIGAHQWASEAVDAAQRRLPGTAEADIAASMLMMARERTRPALKLLNAVTNGDLPAVTPVGYLTAQVMQAGLQNSLGQPILAFEMLQQAVEWAAPRILLRPFMDAWPDIQQLVIGHRERFGRATSFVDDLIDRCASRSNVPAVVLTPRELGILRDLPSRMSLEQISREQGLSVNTVKTHVSSIYRKLGVNRRGEAVERARADGLL